MKEQIVANTSQNLYADERGGNLMADSVSRSEAGKPGGELPREPGIIQEGLKGLGERAGLDRESILENLERGRKENEEALGGMRPVSEMPDLGRRQNEPGPGPGAPEGQRGAEEPIIITSFPHLVNSDKDTVNKRIKEKGLGLKVPDDWDKWGILQRGQWLSSHDIFNVTKLPVKKTIDFSKPILPIGGGETKFTSEELKDMADPRTSDAEIKRNLSALVIEENNNPTAFGQSSGEADRRLLHEMLLEKSHKSGRAADIVQNIMVSTDANQQKALRLYLDFLINKVKLDSAARTNYRFVNNFVREIQALERYVSLDPVQYGIFTQVIDQNLRNELAEILSGKDGMDEYFKKKDKEMEIKNPDLRRSLYANVDTNAINLRNYAVQFGRPFSDIEDGVLQIARSEQQRLIPDQAQLLEWHTVDLLERMRHYIQELQELGVPARWEDALRNVENNLRFIESTDFPLEELSAARDRVIRISEFVSQAAKAERNQETKGKIERQANEINEIKDAVWAIYDLKVALEATGMDPEKVQEHFKSHVWKDYTFKVYFERFSKDHRLVEKKDKDGREINFLDKAMKVYFKKLYDERQWMNEVEQLTLVDIFKELDFSLIESRLGRPIVDRDRLDRTRLELIKTSVGRGLNADTWAVNTFMTKFAVQDWYRKNLLLGAHGVYEASGRAEDKEIDELNRNRYYLDIRRYGIKKQRANGEFYFEGGLIDDLRKSLSAAGGDIKAEDLAEYENSGFMNQLMNNAHRMLWVMGAYSDHDGIRIYKRNTPWYDGRPVLGNFTYNGFSDLFAGRSVDHFAEFLQDEVRGRPGHQYDTGRERTEDANQVFTKHMLGKRRGILGHNRLMVKVIADNLVKDKESRDKLVKDNKDGTFTHLMSAKATSLDNIDKLNVGVSKIAENGEGSISGGDNWDNTWATGAAVEELIDDGKVTFEDIEWSRVFGNEKTNVTKFNMQDWWGDRAGAYKYFGKEMIQEYLQNPTSEKMFELIHNRIFYSAREIRIKPWSKLVIPAHFEIGDHWKKWFGLEYNMPHAEKEGVIDVAISSNRLEKEARTEFRKKWLGWGVLPGIAPVRATREFLEGAYVFAFEGLKRSKVTPFSMFYEFWAQLVKYLASSKY